MHRAILWHVNRASLGAFHSFRSFLTQFCPYTVCIHKTSCLPKQLQKRLSSLAAMASLVRDHQSNLSSFKLTLSTRKPHLQSSSRTRLASNLHLTLRRTHLVLRNLLPRRTHLVLRRQLGQRQHPTTLHLCPPPRKRRFRRPQHGNPARSRL